jgi:hypothetical protein
LFQKPLPDNCPKSALRENNKLLPLKEKMKEKNMDIQPLLVGF